MHGLTGSGIKEDSITCLIGVGSHAQPPRLHTQDQHHKEWLCHNPHLNQHCRMTPRVFASQGAATSR